MRHRTDENTFRSCGITPGDVRPSPPEPWLLRHRAVRHSVDIDPLFVSPAASLPEISFSVESSLGIECRAEQTVGVDCVWISRRLP